MKNPHNAASCQNSLTICLRVSFYTFIVKHIIYLWAYEYDVATAECWISFKRNIKVLWQMAFIIHQVTSNGWSARDGCYKHMNAGITCLLFVVCQTHLEWCRMRAVAFGSWWRITTRQMWRRLATSAMRRELVAWHKKPWLCRHRCLCQQAAACSLDVMKNDLMSWRCTNMSLCT